MGSNSMNKYHLAFYIFVALAAAHQAPPKVSPLPPSTPVVTPAPRSPEIMLASHAAFERAPSPPYRPPVAALEALGAQHDPQESVRELLGLLVQHLDENFGRRT
jgi:hypothetical protein